MPLFLLKNFFRQLSSNDIVEAIDYDEAIVAIIIHIYFLFSRAVETIDQNKPNERREIFAVPVVHLMVDYQIFRIYKYCELDNDAIDNDHLTRNIAISN